MTWDTAVRSDREAREATRTLARITLPSTPLIRQFANEVIADVLYYEQPHHRRAIQQRVISRINEIHATWRLHHPDFVGQARPASPLPFGLASASRMLSMMLLVACEVRRAGHPLRALARLAHLVRHPLGPQRGAESVGCSASGTPQSTATTSCRSTRLRSSSNSSP